MHDLAGLAIAALRHVDLDPGLLNGMVVVGRKPLDRGDLFARHTGDLGDAGAGGLAINMHGAGSAKGHTAAKLGAG